MIISSLHNTVSHENKSNFIFDTNGYGHQKVFFLFSVSSQKEGW